MYDNFISINMNLDDGLKIINTNKFINNILLYKPDSVNYLVKDYWATLKETLSKLSGDCENYAIAKYFTLINLGISSIDLALLYCKYLSMYHIVLAYFGCEYSNPVILDNSTDIISSIRDRKDLVPIFYFDDTNIFTISDNGAHKILSSSLRLKNWGGVMERHGQD